MSGRFQRILRHEVENNQIVRTWVLVEENNDSQNEQTNNPIGLVHMPDILHIPALKIKQEEDIKMEIDLEPPDTPEVTRTKDTSEITYNIPIITTHEIVAADNLPKIIQNHHQMNGPKTIYIQKLEVEHLMVNSDDNTQIQPIGNENSNQLLSNQSQLGPTDFKQKTKYRNKTHSKQKSTIEVTWQCRFCPYNKTHLEYYENTNQTRGNQGGYLRKSSCKEHKRKKITHYYESHLHEI